MRILTYGLSTDKLAGIETFLLNMNKYMSEECIFDYVIERDAVMGESTIHQAAIDEKGGRTFYITPKRNMRQNLKDWKKLLREHGDEYSVAYFNLYAMSWIPPLLLCKKKGMRVFIHAHNNQLHNCGTPVKILHKLGKLITKNKDFVRLTNSGLSTEFMFGKVKNDILIYNAVSMERFGFHQNIRDRVRLELGLKEKHVYGFVGRIAYQKNPLYLIDVFDRIQKTDEKAVLLVGGDGDMMEEVKADISNRNLTEKVILLGNVKNIEDYYQAMDVFMLPSRFEGLGIVLIEAQAAGLPCITSADVVPQEAKTTELLEYISLSDPDLWAKTAVDMAQQTYQREIYKEMIESSHFNIKTEAKRLESILTKL